MNGEGVTLGAYHSLYIYFDTSLAPGTIQVTDYGGPWWQGYTHVGVPDNFPNVPDSSELVMSGTVAALKALRPDLGPLIEDAERIVRRAGDELRFLLRSRETKKFIIDVASTIAVWPQPSLLFVSLTDRSNEAFLEARPFPIGFYLSAFDLAGAIEFKSDRVTILPSKSVAGKLSSAAYGALLSRSLEEFAPAKPLTISRQIKRPR